MIGDEPADEMVVNSPILHDEIAAHSYFFSGRTITYGNGSSVNENKAMINSGTTPGSYVTEAGFETKIVRHKDACADDSIVGMVRID